MSQSSSSSFRAAMKTRRTYYNLSPESNIPSAKIIEIVEDAVLHVPSSFNSQSTRVIVLIGDEHKKLWGEIAKNVLKAVTPPEQWPSTEQKLVRFANAYGTVLFYEDPKPVADLQAKFPRYADKFPQWSEHTSAMHQYAIWTALAQEGLGANLQHYNPLFDEKIAATWQVPVSWALKAQLVFGSPVEKPLQKSFQHLEHRLFIHGAQKGNV